MSLKILFFAAIVFFAFSLPPKTFAQRLSEKASATPEQATESAQIATPAAAPLFIESKQVDLTQPENDLARKIFNNLYRARPVDEPNFLNFIEYTVQYAIRTGVPANTVVLILLLPFLATLFVFIRQVIGIPTLEMLVPIALSATLVATGLFVGAYLLATIFFASIFARLILKKIRIMQLPKMSLSQLIISISVLISLIIAVSLRLFDVSKISFLPVILMVLLSDKVVGLQLTRGVRPAIVITFFTLLLGGIGYAIFIYAPIRFEILLYPELILLLIPINIFIGRYFGLRLTEYHRFASFRKYVN